MSGFLFRRIHIDKLKAIKTYKSQFGSLLPRVGTFLGAIAPKTGAKLSPVTACLVRAMVAKEFKYGYRCMSTNLDISLDEQKGVAIMKMKKPPVNSLNLEFLQEIRSSLITLEQNKKCRGLILTSDVPKIFCAGLDILEMYQPKMERLQAFWRALQDMWLQLYVSPLTTIAAINGHSPAGGCLMSAACDYRIMAPNYTIGLNETQLGIVAPFWFKDSMVNTVGHRETELALQLGYLYKTEEALQKGLIDKVVPLEDVMSILLKVK